MFGLAKKVVGAAAVAGVGATIYSKTRTPKSSQATSITPITLNDVDNDKRVAYQSFTTEQDFPNLSGHNNCMAKVLTPSLYAKLRDIVSSISNFSKILNTKLGH